MGRNEKVTFSKDESWLVLIAYKALKKYTANNLGMAVSWSHFRDNIEGKLEREAWIQFATMAEKKKQEEIKLERKRAKMQSKRRRK